MEVKKSQHKYIVGPKGNTLQEILETTGVSVEMPPLDSGSETIILRGEPDKLGPALTQVYAKVRSYRREGERGGSERVKSDPFVPVQAKSAMVVEVTAPAWLHRFIIGKKGQNIGRITQQLPRVSGGRRVGDLGRDTPRRSCHKTAAICVSQQLSVVS